MTGVPRQSPSLIRFQIERDREGWYRWRVFDSYGTEVDWHAERFSNELEARLDAEHLQRQISSAPIVGLVAERTT